MERTCPHWYCTERKMFMVTGLREDHVAPFMIAPQADGLIQLLSTNGFSNFFLPNACALNGPAALIGDKLGSHFSKAVVDACLQNNIMFITLVPNSTHLAQPLDVAVFRPAKIHWKKLLIHRRKECKTGGCIPKSHFPRLLSSLFALLSLENLKSGFRATGISPLDRNQVLK